MCIFCQACPSTVTDFLMQIFSVGRMVLISHSCGTSEYVFCVIVHCKNFVMKSDLSIALVFTKIDNYKNRSQLSYDLIVGFFVIPMNIRSLKHYTIHIL